MSRCESYPFHMTEADKIGVNVAIEARLSYDAVRAELDRLTESGLIPETVLTARLFTALRQKFNRDKGAYVARELATYRPDAYNIFSTMTEAAQIGYEVNDRAFPGYWLSLWWIDQLNGRDAIQAAAEGVL